MYHLICVAVENVIFCKMSTLQLALYKHLLGSHLVRSCLRRSATFSPHLVCIGALKKLCNSPSFIYEAAAIAGACDERSAREDSPLSTDGVGFYYCQCGTIMYCPPVHGDIHHNCSIMLLSYVKSSVNLGR